MVLNVQQAIVILVFAVGNITAPRIIDFYNPNSEASDYPLDRMLRNILDTLNVENFKFNDLFEETDRTFEESVIVCPSWLNRCLDTGVSKRSLYKPKDMWDVNETRNVATQIVGQATVQAMSDTLGYFLRMLKECTRQFLCERHSVPNIHAEDKWNNALVKIINLHNNIRDNIPQEIHEIHNLKDTFIKSLWMQLGVRIAGLKRLKATAKVNDYVTAVTEMLAGGSSSGQNR